MKCPKCSAEINDGLEKCPECGENIAADKENTPKKPNALVVIIVILLVVVAVMGAVIAKLISDKDTGDADSLPSYESSEVSEDITAPPTDEPTAPPTDAPTEPPTEAPTTEAPTEPPTDPPTDPPTEAPTEEPTPVPVDYLAAYGESVEMSDTYNKDSLFRTYYLFDLNGDGIKELILYFGTCEADAVYKFWTISDREIVYCGDHSGGHTALCEEDGKLYINMGIMGYQVIEEITMTDNLISAKTIYEKDGEATGDYKDIGKALYGCDLSDTSLLKENSTTTVESGYYYSNAL